LLHEIVYALLDAVELHVGLVNGFDRLLNVEPDLAREAPACRARFARVCAQLLALGLDRFKLNFLAFTRATYLSTS